MTAVATLLLMIRCCSTLQADACRASAAGRCGGRLGPACEAYTTSAVPPPPPAAERRSRKAGIGLDIVEGLGCSSQCMHRSVKKRSSTRLC